MLCNSRVVNYPVMSSCIDLYSSGSKPSQGQIENFIIIPREKLSFPGDNLNS